MKMSFRWYGTGFDTVSLDKIAQIPGIKGVITSLMDKQAGEVWDFNEIKNRLFGRSVTSQAWSSIWSMWSG